MKQRLLSPEKVEEYSVVVETYHPNGQVVIDFARSHFAVIAGPTGVGKDSLRNLLVQDQDFIKILSTTSRPPRPNERDDVDYHFRDLDFFDQGIEERRFLQIALVHNQQLSCLDFRDVEQLASGQIGLSLLVVQTEISLRKLNPDLKTIFLVPPSMEELLERMQKDRKIAEDEIKRRVDAASSELQTALNQPSYYCIVNEDLNFAKELATKFLFTNDINAEENSKARNLIKDILSKNIGVTND